MMGHAMFSLVEHRDDCPSDQQDRGVEWRQLLQGRDVLLAWFRTRQDTAASTQRRRCHHPKASVDGVFCQVICYVVFSRSILKCLEIAFILHPNFPESLEDGPCHLMIGSRSWSTCNAACKIETMPYTKGSFTLSAMTVHVSTCKKPPLPKWFWRVWQLPEPPHNQPVGGDGGDTKKKVHSIIKKSPGSISHVW